MKDRRDHEAMATPALPEAEGAAPPSWEKIANGRYMPRRIRGSCLGRELG